MLVALYFAVECIDYVKRNVSSEYRLAHVKNLTRKTDVNLGDMAKDCYSLQRDGPRSTTS